MTIKLNSGAKVYPRCELWDYIATSREDRELDRLDKLRATIMQSKKEFNVGKGICLDAKLLRCSQPATTTPYKVFISPLALEELNQHFHELLHGSANNQDTHKISEQLKDFFLNKLSAAPGSGIRQDAIHKGIRLYTYGFFEIYYCFNGENIYIAHVIYQKDLLR